MKKSYLLPFFICFFMYVTAFAQNKNNVQTVRGTIVDETTQYPLVGALIGVVDYPELSAKMIRVNLSFPRCLSVGNLLK